MCTFYTKVVYHIMSFNRGIGVQSLAYRFFFFFLLENYAKPYLGGGVDEKRPLNPTVNDCYMSNLPENPQLHRLRT